MRKSPSLEPLDKAWNCNFPDIRVPGTKQIFHTIPRGEVLVSELVLDSQTKEVKTTCFQVHENFTLKKNLRTPHTENNPFHSIVNVAVFCKICFARKLTLKTTLKQGQGQEKH